MMLPIHKGTHWCLAIIDFEASELRYYDSLLGNNFGCLKKLRSRAYQPYGIQMENVMPQGTSTVHMVDLIIQLHFMYVAG